MMRPYTLLQGRQFMLFKFYLLVGYSLDYTNTPNLLILLLRKAVKDIAMNNRYLQDTSHIIHSVRSSINKDIFIIYKKSEGSTSIAQRTPPLRL